VGVGVTVGEGVAVGVTEGEGDTVGVGLAGGVGLTVGVGVGVKKLSAVAKVLFTAVAEVVNCAYVRPVNKSVKITHKKIK